MKPPRQRIEWPDIHDRDGLAEKLQIDAMALAELDDARVAALSMVIRNDVMRGMEPEVLPAGTVDSADIESFVSKNVGIRAARLIVDRAVLRGRIPAVTMVEIANQALYPRVLDMGTFQIRMDPNRPEPTT